MTISKNNPCSTRRLKITAATHTRKNSKRCVKDSPTGVAAVPICLNVSSIHKDEKNER